MMGAIEQVDRREKIIASDLYEQLSPDERSIMDMWIGRSDKVWFGLIKDEIVCCWGVLTPSLLSDQAYLWLKTSARVEENKFLFVRYSQLALEEILKDFNSIIGHTKVEDERAIKWLGWLGAEFKPYMVGMLSFEIRKKPCG